MERDELTLASTRVYDLDLRPKKALCLRFKFHLLRQLPSCILDTSLNSTQVALLLNLH
ncbi:hypothetical protein B296_00049948 [Ensete ventricosum]|uniref:Uncharacterized protein n=1 Tax=Ensete ventricosum TaxID=4639 RepID=A0A426YNL0_ENSVE|nr:hypothetical protein B296_00049948 [Ensete ventricosum]